MIGLDVSIPAAALFLFAALTLSCALAFGEALRQRFPEALKLARPAVIAACVPLGLWLMEAPYNPELLQIHIHFVLLGLVMLGLLFCAVFFTFMRSRIAAFVFLVICFVCGTANHFVSLFKGQPILPSDIFALQTAAAVSSGYGYAIDDTLLNCISVLLLAAAALSCIPKAPIRSASKRAITANAACGLAAIVVFGTIMSTVDIEHDWDCTVDVWSTLESYEEHGSLLCFLQRTQKLTPAEPNGYSHERAAELRSAKASAMTSDADAAIEGAMEVADELVEAAQQAVIETRPTIIAIMNETYSDISRYPQLAEAYSGPASIWDRDGVLAYGDVYVSAMGGGTCNSEFEFLTGSSMGLLGAGVYPYMLYDLENADNIAGYLRSIGYQTSAIHPADAQNWRRDRVYEQLGFDEFYDISSFDEAERFRDMVSDAATYDKILEIMDESDGPQFIFDVTIANHGGYDTGLIPEDEQLHVEAGDASSSEIDEYVSSIQRAQREFSEFLDALAQRDEPVIVVFFGDHQPGFVEQLAGDAAADDVEPTIEETQQRYVTPYMVWTNDETTAQTSHDKGLGTSARDTSLNYLAASALKDAGVPLDEYFAFLYAMQIEVPAINLNGYEDAAGTWHWNGESGASDDALAELAIVQHENLFG